MTTPERGRLVWAESPGARDPDGAWSSGSDDATTELLELVPLVSEHLGGSVTRVSLNIESWGPDQPRRLRIDDKLVRLGWFHTLDPATITLARGGDDRVVITILPSSTTSTSRPLGNNIQ